MAPEGAAGSRRERNSDVEVLHCRSIEMLGSLVAPCDYRPALSTPNVRGRRLALGTTALMSPPMHRRATSKSKSLDLLIKRARVLRRSGVMDSSPLYMRSPVRSRIRKVRKSLIKSYYIMKKNNSRYGGCTVCSVSLSTKQG